MVRGEISNEDMDGMLSRALSSDAMLEVPAGLSEKFIQKLEKRLVLKELLLELGLKMSIALGSLLVLASVFLFLKGTTTFKPLQHLIISNWQLIISVLLIAFVTLLIDQVGMRYFISPDKHIGLKV